MVNEEEARDGIVWSPDHVAQMLYNNNDAAKTFYFHLFHRSPACIRRINRLARSSRWVHVLLSALWPETLDSAREICCRERVVQQHFLARVNCYRFTELMNGNALDNRKRWCSSDYSGKSMRKRKLHKSTNAHRGGGVEAFNETPESSFRGNTKACF